MTEKKKTFSWRGWTTFVTTLSFIVDTLSGIVLYIAPPGRIANWTNWNVWGLNREEWVAIHTIFGYVVLFIVALHLYYNWKMFWNFIWNKLRRAMNLKWEMGWATLLCLLIFLGTLWEIPPFSSTMELGDFFKDSWEESKIETPLAHGELLSLKEFAEKTNVPVEQILDALKSKGYKVKNIEQTVGEVAKENGVPPNKLYEDMKSGGVKPAVSTIGEGSGMGRKSVEVICSETGLSLDDALARLKQKGINAKPSDKLKELANKAGKTPMDIYNIIAGQN